MVHAVPARQRLLTGRPLLLRGLLAAVTLTIDLMVWGGLSLTWSGIDLPTWPIVVIMILAYACLSVFRSPVPGYLAILGVVLCSLVVPAVETFAGFGLALFLMARLPDRRMAYLALAGALVPITLNTVTGYYFAGSPGPSFVFFSGSLWTILYVAAWCAGRMLAASDRRLNRHQATAVAAQEQAVAEERVRISRELHDSVAHSLTAIVLQSAGARTALRRRAASEEDVAELLSGIESTASQSMRELHRMLGLLRAAEPGIASGSAEDGVRHGPGQAPLYGLDEIAGLVETARASGVDVVTTASGTPVAVDPSIGHTVYRAAQEGLSNVMKHAGPGARAELTLDWLPARLVVSVRNTRGIDSPTASVSGGFGLTGLRERLDVVGGTLQVGPTADGYLLQAGVPTTAGQDSGTDGGEHDGNGSGHGSTAQTPFSTTEGD